MVASAMICIFVLPVFGKLCDVVDPRKIMPFAFLARCSTTYLFTFLKDPASMSTFVVCVSMVIATLAEQISCDSIFMKNLNKETRGILCGAYSFFGQIGILVFSLVGGYLFDNLGNSSPFIAVGILDFVFIIIFLTFMFKRRNAVDDVHSSEPRKREDEAASEDSNERLLANNLNDKNGGKF